MTALIIICAIIVSLVLISCIKVCAQFSLNSDIEFKVSLLSKTLFKLPTSKKIVIDSSGAAHKIKKKRKSFFAQLKEKEGTFEALKRVVLLIEITVTKAVKLLGKIRFDKFKLYITVADEDSAKTALIYSGVCAVVFPLISFIECNTKSFNKDISVNADFDSKSFDIDFEVKAYLRIYNLLFFAVALLFAFVKQTQLTKNKGA